ncbi:EF-hand domain-containing protein [Arenimonas sp. MALMAid1274]|uniref:EF-hand domain-containing protein n=1 Tax=Arenimonas sp. MALMAid1274 TaxID=3411630 RepID=UPI003BA260BB
MKTLPFALCTLLATGAAFAQSQEVTLPVTEGTVTVKSVQPPIANASDYQVKVADVDANGDGVISKKEVPTDHALYFEFKLVDTDGNGRVTDEELANWK